MLAPMRDSSTIPMEINAGLPGHCTILGRFGLETGWSMARWNSEAWSWRALAVAGLLLGCSSPKGTADDETRARAAAALTIALVDAITPERDRAATIERAGGRLVAKLGSAPRDGDASRRMVASAPMVAHGALRFEEAGHADVSLEVLAEGRAPVEAQVTSGAAVYGDAEPDTDVVIQMGQGWLEELRLLRSDKARATVHYHLHRGPGTKSLRLAAGSVEALDEQGRVLVKSLAAFAVDAAGTRRALSAQLEAVGEADALFTLSLDVSGLVFPVLVDPMWVSGIQWPPLAVLALNSVSLKKNSSVQGDVAVLDAAPAKMLDDDDDDDDKAELAVGVGTLLSRNASANRVLLRSKSAVFGTLAFNQLTASKSATVGAKNTPLPLPLVIKTPSFPTIAAGMTNVVVPGKAQQNLAPGAYGKVRLEAGNAKSTTVLTLTGGLYQLRELRMGSRSRLECAAACEVRIERRLRSGNHAYIGPALASPVQTADVQIFVLGAVPPDENGDVNKDKDSQVNEPNGDNNNKGEVDQSNQKDDGDEADDQASDGDDDGLPATFKKTAVIGMDNVVHARIFVPGGTLWLKTGTAADGRFIGRDVLVGSKVKVSMDSGPSEPDCDAYCTEVLGAKCALGPASQAKCLSECKANLAGPFCTEQTAAFVICTNGAAIATCDGSDKPKFTGCAAELQSAQACQALCAKAFDGNPCTIPTCDCTIASCDPATAIKHPPRPNGTTCDDGNACTVTDACQAGVCTGSNPVVCSALDSCHVAGTCNPATGICSNPAKVNGSSCDDGNACTKTDTCQTGSCIGSNPVLCSALDPCHVAGTCNPATGVCSNPAKANGTACNDGNACTLIDTCQAGTCAGTSPVVCAAPAPCHAAGTCNPATGACSNPLQPDGTICSGGNLCTKTATCLAGMCKAATPVVCTALDACHELGTCDPATGTCSNPPKANGASCSTGNLCIQGQVCTAGSCVGGTPAAIDDGIACTIDTCDPQTGVKHRACSKLDLTVASTLYEAAKFLFTGSDPVQTGVVPGTIDPLRIAVLRGKVKTIAGDPLADVAVRVTKRSTSAADFGTTRTAYDGVFALAANGGGDLIVSYAKTGYLEVQREVTAPWQDYVDLPDVVMIAADSAATNITFGSPTMQAHRAKVVSDASGSRQATVLFPSGTTAEMIFPNGTGQSVNKLTVRATEFTAGAPGPAAMPQLLPPTSGYTYALELEGDEAAAAGATRVNFNQPVILYLENFLGFPAGLAVPLGAYSRQGGCWKPEPNGTVITILSISAGSAVIDSNGDGLPDDAATLLALGVSPEELAQLALLYQPGQSLWRVPLSHFTPFDCNWPQDCKSPPCPAPKGGGASPNPDPDCPKPCASLAWPKTQKLSESLPIVGTPFTLNYASDRIAGRKSELTRTTELTTSSPPASLQQIDFSVDIAGRHFVQSFLCPLQCEPNKKVDFTWDGKDLYGRVLQGKQRAIFTVEYVYQAVYVEPASGGASFAQSGKALLTVPSRTPLRKKTVTEDALGPWDAVPQGLGGWSLDVHHGYDPIGKVLYFGSGERRRVETLPTIIRTVGGGKPCCNLNEGGKATEAWMSGVAGLEVAPDGSIYFTNFSQNRVRKIDKDGIVTTVAGTGTQGYSGDGGPATLAELNTPWDLALAPDGTLCITDRNNQRVREHLEHTVGAEPVHIVEEEKRALVGDVEATVRAEREPVGVTDEGVGALGRRRSGAATRDGRDDAVRRDASHALEIGDVERAVRAECDAVRLIEVGERGEPAVAGISLRARAGPRGDDPAVLVDAAQARAHRALRAMAVRRPPPRSTHQARSRSAPTVASSSRSRTSRRLPMSPPGSAASDLTGSSRWSPAAIQAATTANIAARAARPRTHACSCLVVWP